MKACCLRTECGAQNQGGPPAWPHCINAALLCQLHNQLRVAIVQGTGTPSDLHYFVSLHNVFCATMNVLWRGHGHNRYRVGISGRCEGPGSYAPDEFDGCQPVVCNEDAATSHTSACAKVANEQASRVSFSHLLTALLLPSGSMTVRSVLLEALTRFQCALETQPF